jgi:hypothetical protein
LHQAVCKGNEKDFGADSVRSHTIKKEFEYASLQLYLFTLLANVSSIAIWIQHAWFQQRQAQHELCQDLFFFTTSIGNIKQVVFGKNPSLIKY